MLQLTTRAFTSDKERLMLFFQSFFVFTWRSISSFVPSQISPLSASVRVLSYFMSFFSIIIVFEGLKQSKTYDVNITSIPSLPLWIVMFLSSMGACTIPEYYIFTNVHVCDSSSLLNVLILTTCKYVLFLFRN